MHASRTTDQVSVSTRAIGSGVLGMIAGLVFISPFAAGWWECYSPWTKTYLVMAWSALGAGIISFSYLKMRSAGRHIRVTDGTLQIPGIGEVALSIDDTQREAGWRLFVELATRVSTQELKVGTGLIREALTSLYGLFQLIREELKAIPPTTDSHTNSEADVQAFALAVLNRAIRPCLSRWHPQLKQWEDMDLPENLWPLADVCRKDLETTRQAVVELAVQLGVALGVNHAGQLLNEPTGSGLPVFVKDEEFADVRQALEPRLDSRRLAAAWRVYVQMSTRIATQTLAKDAGLISEALASLHELFNNLRDELSLLEPPFCYSENATSLEDAILRIMNIHLRPFLTVWHSKHKMWVEVNGEQSEWPQESECRAALEILQNALQDEMNNIADLLRFRKPQD